MGSNRARRALAAIFRLLATRLRGSIPLLVVSALLLLACAPAVSAEIKTGQFNVKCTPLGAPAEVHYLKDDPIVKPGQPGASHEHVFAGNRSTNAFSTNLTMQSATSALTEQRNLSGYWTPAVFYNGVRQAPIACLIYYRAGRSLTTVTPQPTGLKLLAGNPHATSPQSSGTVTWTCVPALAGQPTTTPPTNCNGGKLQAIVKSSECWDGVHLDSADHRAHMARSLGSATTGRYCPADHPVMLGQVQQIWTYPDPAGRALTLASGSGYGMHADFWWLWPQPLLQGYFDTCINANVDCGTVDTTPPNTTITSGPANGASPDATFTFTGTDNIGVTGFDCQLDAGAWAACTSPQSYTNLPVGTHTFEVRANDAAGNVDATPASYAWTIDPSRPLAIWGTDFEDGNADEYNAVRKEGSGYNATQAVVSDEARTGLRSLRIIIPGSTTVGGVSRYQLVSSMTRDVQGADRYYGFSYKLADNWNMNQIAEGGYYFASIFGFRWWGTTANGPGSNLDMIGSIGSPVYATSSNLCGSVGCPTDWDYLGPVIKNEWTDWVFHIKWSQGSDGVREVWRNGVKVGDYHGPTMLYDYPFEHRIGIYQGTKVDHTRTFYIDNHRVGTSYAAVDPSL